MSWVYCEPKSRMTIVSRSMRGLGAGDYTPRSRARCYSLAPRMRQVPTIVILGVAIGAACSHVPPVAPPTLFPMATAWTTPLPAVVEGPLAADATAVYVATRDGGLRSPALSTGAVRWEASGRPGTVAAGEGALVLHEEGGTVWSIDPATGATRWKVDSGVPGTLPAALYK